MACQRARVKIQNPTEYGIHKIFEEVDQIQCINTGIYRRAANGFSDLQIT